MGFSRQEYWSGVPLPFPLLRGRGGNFQELGHGPLSDLHGQPWNYYGLWGMLSNLLMCYNGSFPGG